MNKKRGRKQIDNVSVLNDILDKPAEREVFIEQINKLVGQREQLDGKVKFYNDDVKSTAEAYKLGKGFVSKVVGAVAKGNIKDVIDKLTSEVDLLQVLDEQKTTD
jgi:hypothetical protein